MYLKYISSVLLLTCIMVPAVQVQAQATTDIKSYFSDAAVEVKAESDPDQKREILGSSLQRMSDALDKVQRSPLVSDDDRASMDGLRADIKEKQAELAGTNGFNPVPDAQLNSFADYVVQDMEQADKMITVSVVTALLILIIVILLV